MAHPVVHFEVAGKDLDKLQWFYGELFGWRTQVTIALFADPEGHVIGLAKGM